MGPLFVTNIFRIISSITSNPEVSIAYYIHGFVQCIIRYLCELAMTLLAHSGLDVPASVLLNRSAGYLCCLFKHFNTISSDVRFEVILVTVHV